MTTTSAEAANATRVEPKRSTCGPTTRVVAKLMTPPSKYSKSRCWKPRLNCTNAGMFGMTMNTLVIVSAVIASDSATTGFLTMATSDDTGLGSAVARSR